AHRVHARRVRQGRSESSGHRHGTGRQGADGPRDRRHHRQPRPEAETAAGGPALVVSRTCSKTIEGAKPPSGGLRLFIFNYSYVICSISFWMMELLSHSSCLAGSTPPRQVSM